LKSKAGFPARKKDTVIAYKRRGKSPCFKKKKERT